ncbi:flagellar filament capping protein FliD [Nocardioides sp.]|uniref:flagellar filament capping protein FliD n=1 Tax=Nocardioides sp. TaxID=35761 RepID=UPI003515A579
MAGTSSVGGLASGLDTASLVNQLIALEARSQTKLKTQVSSEQSKVGALQKVNTALQALSTAAGGFTGAASSSSTTNPWTTLKATSSNAAVAISATSAAAPGQFTVTVNQTALSHQLAFTEPHARTDVVTGAGTSVTLTRSGQPDLTISTANGTLDELAAAINGADAGVRATLVRTGSASGVDQYRLLVESSTTGAGQAFGLTDAGGADLMGGTTVRAGRDASIDIGGITATSSTNTFADLVPGVTVTLASNATGTADIDVSRDAAKQSDAVKGFVDQINALITQIGSFTSNDKNAKGVLAGDSTLSSLASRLQDAVFPPDGTSMAKYGIQVDRFGKVTFDPDKFASSFAADPVAAATAFTGPGGFADRVKGVADTSSDRFNGSITAAINSRTSTISRLNASIADWDDRLALRRSNLERQYTQLETTLSQLQGQQSWLTSQLKSLQSSTQ